jgi:hypothetical protein
MPPVKHPSLAGTAGVHDDTTMPKRTRSLVLAGVAVVTALVAAGCGSSLTPGEQAAQNTRIATAQQYWKALAVIKSLIEPETGGDGAFVACPTTGNIAYAVDTAFISSGGRTGPVPFAAAMERAYRAHGWSAFTADPTTKYAKVATRGRYRLTIRPSRDPADSLEVYLTFRGPCVAVGRTYARAAPHLRLHDTYPDLDLTDTPTPTGPLPTPG